MAQEGKILAQGCSASTAGSQTQTQFCLAPEPAGTTLLNTVVVQDPRCPGELQEVSGWCSRYVHGGWDSPKGRHHLVREAVL